MAAKPGQSNRLWGITCVAAVCAIWVASSYVTAYLVQPGSSLQLQPAFLSMIGSSCLLIAIPGVFLQRCQSRRRRSRQQGHACRGDAGAQPELEAPLLDGTTDSDTGPAGTTAAVGSTSSKRPSDSSIFFAALLVAPIWYMAQMTFALSLAYTSVASNTVLSSSSCLFTLLASAILAPGMDRLTGRKALGCLLCIVGVACVTLCDSWGAASSAATPCNLGCHAAGSHIMWQSASGWQAHSISKGSDTTQAGFAHWQLMRSISYRDLLGTTSPGHSLQPAKTLRKLMQAAGSGVSASGVITPLADGGAASAGAATGTAGYATGAVYHQQQILLHGDSPSPSPCPSRPVIGDVLALVSAACYGLYTVLLRSRLAAATSRARGTARESDNDDVVEDGEEDSSEVDAGTTSLFLGFLGLIMLVGALLPYLAVDLYLGRPPLGGASLQAAGVATLEGLVDYALADILWARAVVLLSPTAATAGLSAQIPVAAVIDAILGNRSWTATPASVALFVLGSLAVVAGFILTAIEDQEEEENGDSEDGAANKKGWFGCKRGASSDGTSSGKGVPPGSPRSSVTTNATSHMNPLHATTAVTHAAHSSAPHFAPIQAPTAGALVSTSPRRLPASKHTTPALAPASMLQQGALSARQSQQLHGAAGQAISADQEDAIMEHVLSSSPSEHPRRRGR